MSLSVGELVGYLRLDKSQWDRGLTGAETDAKKTSGKVGAGFVALGGVLAAAGVGTFLKGAIDGASDLNETISKVGVIFGDQSGAIEAFASDANNKLGSTRQAALDAAATFGVFGKAAGLTGAPLTEFSTDMVQLATDMASFSNTSVDEAVVAIGSALRGESEPIRSFGVLLDDATLRARALKLGLIKTTKEALTPQKKALAAQAEILAQTADAQGDFARTSTGMANKQKILTAKLDETKTKIGSALLPVMSELVSVGTKVIDFITEHSEVVKPLLIVLGSLGAIIGVVAAAQWVWAAAVNATIWPVVAVVAAIALLAAGLIYAYKHSETFRDIVKDAWEKIQAAVKFAWESVIKPIFETLSGWYDTLKTVAQWLWDKIKFVWESISGAIQAAWDWLSPLFEDFAEDYEDLWESAENAWHKIEDAWTGIKATVASAMDWIHEKIGTKLEAMKMTWDTGWNLIKLYFIGVWETIKNTVGPIIDFITGKVEWLIARIKELMALLRDAGGGIGLGGGAGLLGGGGGGGTDWLPDIPPGGRGSAPAGDGGRMSGMGGVAVYSTHYHSAPLSTTEEAAIVARDLALGLAIA